MVVPLYTSAPAVRFGFWADMNADATQWSAGLCPGGASADRACRPLMRIVWSLTRLERLVDERQLGQRARRRHVVARRRAVRHEAARRSGSSGWPPSGASSVAAGIIESSSGSANVTPAPRRKVRRGMCFFEINMCAISLCLNEPPVELLPRSAWYSSGTERS